MKEILLFFAFCIAVLAAPRPTQDDFNACYEKNKNSIISVNSNYGVAVAPNLIAVVKNSQTNINSYIKFDPYLGLYLVKSEQNLEVPNMIDENDNGKFNKTTWVGTLSDNNSTIMGHVKSFSTRLGEFDTLSFDTNVTAQLNSPCCKMVGIAIGKDKFIPARYLRHFAAYDDVYYGDIGVVFEEKNGKFFVNFVDPLGRGKALMQNDEVLSLEGKSINSLRLLNEAILFAKKGSILEFRIKRGEDEMKIFIPVSGDISLKSQKIDESKANLSNKNISVKTDIPDLLDEILLKWGISVDKNLRVRKVIEDSSAFKFGIKQNDKILQINNEPVKNRKDLLEKIDKENGFSLLFRRNNFDFFARISR